MREQEFSVSLAHFVRCGLARLDDAIAEGERAAERESALLIEASVSVPASSCETPLVSWPEPPRGTAKSGGVG